MPTFYIDTTTFETATAVYTTSALTTKASNGVYASCGYWRRQTAGVLEPGIYRCDAVCAARCGTTPLSTPDQKGWFKGHYDTGATLGAIRVEMRNTSTSPVAFICELGSEAYPDPNVRRKANKSYAAGYTEKVYTYSVDPCNPEGTVISSISVFQRNSGAWDNTGITTTEYITSGTNIAGTPTLIMYIPKTSNQYTLLDYAIVQPCATGYTSTLRAECPVLLPSFSASQAFSLKAGACAASTYPIQLYQGHVNGTAGTTWGLYDWVFKDPYSSELADDGWYRLPSGLPGPNVVMSVANGLVLSIATCP